MTTPAKGREIKDRIRVRICDETHPHYPETGVLTGEMISLFGTPMAKLALDNCEHGTDACFVSKGQVVSLHPERKDEK